MLATHEGNRDRGTRPAPSLPACAPDSLARMNEEIPGRWWVLQIGVGPIPTDADPGILADLDRLETIIRGTVPETNRLTINTFYADPSSERASLEDTLDFHRLQHDGGCACGWTPPGSHARHVIDVFEDSVRVRSAT